MIDQDPNNCVTFIITGCNRGLGYQLLRMIAFKNTDVFVIATVRTNPEELKKKMDEDFVGNKITVMKLDLSDQESINNFGAQVKALGIRIDALVNNGAVMHDNLKADGLLTPEKAQQTFKVNVHGTMALTNELLPLLKDNGRIINVSSALGGLKYQGKNIQEKFENPEISIAEIQFQIQKYIQGCAQKNLGQFFNSGYGTSKMMLNAWSRYILPKTLKETQTSIAMSPGHCRTEMGGQTAERSAQQGALSIYILLWGEYSKNVFYHAKGLTDYYKCTI